MKRLYAGLLAAALAVSYGSDAAGAAEAENWTPEQRKLLEETLSLNELQRDVERIAAQQETLTQRRKQLGEEIDALEARIAENRERTDGVVRAQYMQQQRPLIYSLLASKSLGSFLQLYKYYQLAIRHDEQLIGEFREDTQKLQSRREELSANSARLDEVKRGIEQQQARLKRLREDIDSGLLASGDPESMSRMAEELNAYWNNVGLYEVDEYFASLAAASSSLPDFLQSSGKMNVSGLGTRYTIDLTDAELNDFLRSQNADLENFAFTFEQDRIVAEGRQDRLTLRIEGRYTLETEPQNAVLFHVDRLVFNGLELPESTRLELESKYDLGFYPQQVAPVEVTGVEMTPGSLRIKLRLVL
ncbi:hypothetical protein QWJ34_05420 [Saccharibacillus sp. CPCC 101409]|uniref:hypothetical protein n=1 Tax=Saccharibacillus sp. CPCC 101409 TaxID=3058041 RepID=UPI0026729E55|nr:hypothetical protein [Saccharibacillus sp. CPCC 101409]MDO3409195.1 hypothetical protein [Saccharibacillus sp. CPCC 101409]